MATKLNWEYETAESCEIAWHAGYRIKAERDPHPENPFEDGDCNWPIAVDNGERHSRELTEYPKDADLVRMSLVAISDGQLIHDQLAIAKVLDTSIHDITCNLEDGPFVYCHDADILRENFWEVLAGLGRSAKLDAACELYNLAGIVAYCGETRGYCQGDWAKVLVVATPEKVKEFGCTDLKPEDLKATVDLYGDWAWGNVYGYVIEKREKAGCSIYLDTDAPQEVEIVNLPSLEEAEEFLGTSATIDPDLLEAGKYSLIDYDDPDAEVWEEIPDGSCWGYYGTEHDESGLDDAAWDALQSIIHQRQRARFAKLKELIRNRVPLGKRAQLLREAA